MSRQSKKTKNLQGTINVEIKTDKQNCTFLKLCQKRLMLQD